MTIADWFRRPTATVILPLATGGIVPEETFTLKGCWRRKEVVHPIADKAIVLELANTHPYTIRISTTLFAEYTRIYGEDEAAVLYRGRDLNAVESKEKAWVKGGVYVEADPKPAPAAGGVVTPFGVSQSASGPVDLSQNVDLEALIDRVMVSVLKRAGLWNPSA